MEPPVPSPDHSAEPVYWQPPSPNTPASGYGYGWDSPQPAPSLPPHGGKHRRGRAGMLGGLAALVATLGKYGLVALKFGKLGPTFISMALSFIVLAAQFGWQFGAGVLALIGIHEVGHMLFARSQGLRASWPIFVPFMGAFVRTPKPGDQRQAAIIAIGGPVVGTAAALACFAAARSLAGPTHLYYLLVGLAYFGCFINLFNLVPVAPLDGGRVAGAVSKWANAAGLTVLALYLVNGWESGQPINPFLLVIVVIGGITTVQRFRQAARGMEPPPLPTRTRFWIAIAYFSILVISAIGMTAAHNTLVDGTATPANSGTGLSQHVGIGS